MEDVAASVALHREVLGGEFVARGGPRFLRAYYRAWLASPGGLGFVATGDDGRVAGVVLGATDPARHVASMLRRHGLGLALRLAAGALVRPVLARELLVTRTARYAGGLWRHLGPPSARHRVTAGAAGAAHIAGPVSPGPPTRTGEVTHLLVAPYCQGVGVGRRLLDAAVDAARRSRLDEMVLVTPPGDGAGAFYERLGWSRTGPVVSRSGEPFERYRLDLSE